MFHNFCTICVSVLLEYGYPHTRSTACTIKRGAGYARMCYPIYLQNAPQLEPERPINNRQLFRTCGFYTSFHFIQTSKLCFQWSLYPLIVAYRECKHTGMYLFQQLALSFSLIRNFLKKCLLESLFCIFFKFVSFVNKICVILVSTRFKSRTNKNPLEKNLQLIFMHQLIAYRG